MDNIFMPAQKVDAAYIHVPFCLSKCAYCDFYSLAASKPALIESWLQALLKEIETAAVRAKTKLYHAPLKTIYFGGGTPSLLKPQYISQILEALATSFGVLAASEITLEANPGSIDQQYLHAIKSAGVNRLSIGLQAAQDKLLKKLGRAHTRADFLQTIRSAEALAFSSISVDIMLGIPTQTLADLEATLALILSLPLTHVSFYSLIVEPHTPFYDLYEKNILPLPDEDLEREMYHFTLERLAQGGLQTYEISNAARPGAESKHNLVYWQAKQYYGFGPAAHGYLEGIRRGNIADLQRYIDLWQEQAAPFCTVVSSENIDFAERQKEKMLLGLRLLAGVSKVEFQEEFGQAMDQVFAGPLKKLVAQGLLLENEETVRLSSKGLDFANIVFREFV